MTKFSVLCTQRYQIEFLCIVLFKARYISKYSHRKLPLKNVAYLGLNGSENVIYKVFPQQAGKKTTNQITPYSISLSYLYDDYDLFVLRLF